MEIHDRIDDLAQVVETARAVPLSASCVVPRNDVLEMLEDVRAALPEAVREADEVLLERDDLLEEAKRQADRSLDEATRDAEDMVARARAEAERAVSDADREAADIVEEARDEAESMLERARTESRRLIDEQEVLHAAQREAAELLEQARIRGREVIDQAEARAEELLAAANSETSAERLATDEFVDGKLADLEESLASSLAAVRRGRDKIHNRRVAYKPIDIRDGDGVGAGPSVAAGLYDQAADLI